VRSLRFLVVAVVAGASVIVAWVFGSRALPVLRHPHRPESFKPPSGVTFQQSSNEVAWSDFLEVIVRVGHPTAKNPFIDAYAFGCFKPVNGKPGIEVQGFCDSPNGSIYRVRFMPRTGGDYEYRVTFRQDGHVWVAKGSFKAVDRRRRGLLRPDERYPWHFVWEGTGEHCFVNGTTAFLLMGWKDEKVIEASIDRLNRLAVNRLRVLLDGRSDHFWTEPIRPGKDFSANLLPWQAKHPDNVKDPGFDYSRFNCDYWQKFERMLRYARDKDMVVSVIFGWNDTNVHPVADSMDERRYFNFAVARLASFSNVTWDLGDDLNGFRSDTWTHDMGTALYQSDPYHHLATSHPTDNRYQDRTSSWFGMTSYQWWRRPLHEWMLKQRQEQQATGRVIPQLNEEYGYEDHYPAWAPYRAPVASAEENRRAAWEIAMAGCYQTTGETARDGTGVAPDPGGGWINGRGNETMTMLEGYARMVTFFSNVEWWTASPHDELVKDDAYCLADPGKLYIAYLPHGGKVTVGLGHGRYQATWFNPRTGAYLPLAPAEGPQWTSPATSDQEDWTLLLKRIASTATSGGQ